MSDAEEAGAADGDGSATSGAPAPVDDVHFGLVVVEDGPRVVFALERELDPHTAPRLRDAVDSLAPTTTELVLDLSAVTFIDSSGLREIIHAREVLLGREGRLLLRAPSATTMRLLEISGLTEHLDIER